MRALSIDPIPHVLDASVSVPGSKSHTNRALVAAALAAGNSRLAQPLIADDTRYMAAALADLGIAVDVQPDAITVVGEGGRLPAARAELYVGNAGTAARFLTALLTLGHGEYTLDGDERMRQRPLGDLVQALRQLGAELECPTGCPPVRVRAAGLPGGEAAIAGEVSSQFLSALLLTAPYARAPVSLSVSGGLNSKPYVDMTLAVMSDFGVRVEREGFEHFRIAPACYQARQPYPIAADATSASYFFAAPALLGGRVRVQNIGRGSNQGDLAFLDVLSAMGCEVAVGDREVEIRVPAPEALRGVEADMRDIPDTAQTLAAVAPFACSPTTIRGIASARVKETDRVAAMCAELSRLGVPVTQHADGLTIQPWRAIRPAVVRTYNDHRMAMAFALIGLKVPGVQIENPQCVSKTFPNYFQVLDQLRRAAEG